MFLNMQGFGNKMSSSFELLGVLLTKVLPSIQLQPMFVVKRLRLTTLAWCSFDPLDRQDHMPLRGCGWMKGMAVLGPGEGFQHVLEHIGFWETGG
jgi:hypothetical protein